MKAGAQFRRGIKRAIKITGTSSRQASIKAGYNQHQINRFIGGMDIKLTTLDDLCCKGFGLSFEGVFRMGK